jgi:hypothetical protein
MFKTEISDQIEPEIWLPKAIYGANSATAGYQDLGLILVEEKGDQVRALAPDHDLVAAQPSQDDIVQPQQLLINCKSKQVVARLFEEKLARGRRYFTVLEQ